MADGDPLRWVRDIVAQRFTSTVAGEHSSDTPKEAETDTDATSTHVHADVPRAGANPPHSTPKPTHVVPLHGVHPHHMHIEGEADDLDDDDDASGVYGGVVRALLRGKAAATTAAHGRGIPIVSSPRIAQVADILENSISVIEGINEVRVCLYVCVYVCVLVCVCLYVCVYVCVCV